MKTNTQSSRLGTVIDAGFPYAFSARLLPWIKANAYTLGSEGYADNFQGILERHDALILGDLPTSPEQDPQAPMLRRWISNGGRLLYFPGWKDEKFLKNNEDLFGIKLKLGSQADSSKKNISWNGTQYPDFGHLPGIRYLYDVTPQRLCKIIMVSSTDERQPVLVQHAVGEGIVNLLLGPISLPSGAEWLAWTNLPHFIGWLLELNLEQNEKKQERGQMPFRSQRDVIEFYSKMLRDGLKDKAEVIQQLTESIPEAKRHAPSLSAEMCQFLRIVGQKAGDRLAVNLSWRMLKNCWGELEIESTFDYAHFQKSWYHFREILDSIYYDGSGNLKSIIGEAKEAFEAHASVRLSGMDPDQGYNYILNGLEALAEATEGRHEPYRIIEYIKVANKEFNRINNLPFSHIKAKAISVCLRLAMKLIPGLESKDEISPTIDDIEKNIRDLSTRSIELDFVKSIHNLLSAIRYLENNDEPAAWRELTGVRDRIIQGIMIMVLKLRNALNLDPLCFIKTFQEVDSSARTKLAQCILDLSRMKIEREPICVFLVFVSDRTQLKIGGKIEQCFMENSLFKNVKLIENEATRKVASLSRIWSGLACTPDGIIFGGIEEPDLEYARDHLEGNLSGKLRNLLAGPTGTVITISSQNGTIRIRDKSGRGLDYSRGNWRLSNLISSQELIELVNANLVNSTLCSESGRKLVEILGDLQSAGDEEKPGFHGTTIVAYRPDDSIELPQSEVVDPPLFLTKMSERMRTGIFLDDGAVFIEMPTGAITRKNVKLPVKPETEKAIMERYNHLRTRGTRHKSAIGYSMDNPTVLVFVLSQDGGCLMVVNGGIHSLW